MKIINSRIFENFPEIKFGFSTKIGLQREAPFHFNMSKSVGDDPQKVEENRKVFFNEIGLNENQIAYQKQVHGDKIKIVTEPGIQAESDAMITDKSNIGLAVSTADCTPIFICDKKKKVIAAVHSGWRSTKEKILFKTLQKLETEFHCKPAELICYIGPCISQKNYEVSHDFKNYFDAKYLKSINDKYLFDLKSANYDMLTEFRIPEESIEVSELCSFEEEYLHSYRREGKVSGRALGVIAVDDSNILTE